MRFNDMELTFARGTLTEEFRAEVDDLLEAPIYFDVQSMERH